MPRKRGNGEGAIYKKTIKGNEYYIVEIDIDSENGKRQKKSTSSKTHAEAVAKLKKMQADLLGGVSLQRDKITLYEWLKECLNTYKQGILKPSTYDSYIKLIRCYIENSILGKKQLQKIDSRDIQRFLNPIVIAGRKESARKLRILFNLALKKAVVARIIPLNFISDIELPKKYSAYTAEILTKEQIILLKKAATEIKAAEIESFNKIKPNKKIKLSTKTKTFIGSRIAEAISLALDTGLRRGELLGLTWDDFDSENKRLFIRNNVVDISGKKTILSPKTPDGIRTIHLMTETVKILSDMKKVSSSNYVFCQRDGQPMSPRHFSKLYKRVCDKAGIKNTRLHTLRHTNATESLAAKMDYKALSTQLGHKDIRTTLNIYVHPSEEFYKGEVAKLEASRRKPS